MSLAAVPFLPRSLNFPICIWGCIWCICCCISNFCIFLWVPFFPRKSSPLPLPTCESATGMATFVSDCCYFGLQITGEDSWSLSRFAKYSEANLGRTRNLDLFQRYETTNIKVLKKCCLSENRNPIIGLLDSGKLEVGETVTKCLQAHTTFGFLWDIIWQYDILWYHRIPFRLFHPVLNTIRTGVTAESRGDVLSQEEGYMYIIYMYIDTSTL